MTMVDAPQSKDCVEFVCPNANTTAQPQSCHLTQSLWYLLYWNQSTLIRCEICKWLWRVWNLHSSSVSFATRDYQIFFFFFFWTEMSQTFPGVLIFLWIEKEKMPIWLAAALPRCYNIANVRPDGWKFSLKTEIWRNFYLFCVVPHQVAMTEGLLLLWGVFYMVCRSDYRFVYLLSLTWIMVIRIQSSVMV